MDGLRLALSWLTVLPVPVRAVDGRSCARAITLAPLTGMLIGAGGAAVLWTATTLGVPGSLAGILVVTVLALITRGMHLDGLADTVDGLGCYGPPERALRVMRDGSTGPFAVVALIVTIGAQALALGELAAAERWPAVVLACVAGRAAFALCCLRGIPAARPEGMGALVAGSQPLWIACAWWGGLLFTGAAVVPGTWWSGPIAVAASGAAALAFGQHARRRFGGITGDVLGASSEIGTTIVLVVCCAA